MTTLDEEYAKKLTEWHGGEGDIEIAHIAADDIIILLLEGLGYQKTVAAWKNVPKWYA